MVLNHRDDHKLVPQYETQADFLLWNGPPVGEEERKLFAALPK